MLNKFQDIDKFNKEKEKILSKTDLSKKGHVDKEIKPIVDIINSKEDLCTTSSCAGRITLLERRSAKKIDAKWLFSSHNPVKFNDVKKSLESESDVWLMQESCIIHVFCRTLEIADKFLVACREAGFKRSGIIAMKNRIMIESMGNEKVEAILIKEGEILVSDKHLKILIDECNIRMKKNRTKMELFKKALEKI
jgi:tRNA wybutosine-synthesizing protein 3